MVMKMTYIQWKNLNSWRIRLWPTWRESSRTSDLEETLNTSSKVDPVTVDPVVQGSEETEVVHLQGLTARLDTNMDDRYK